MSEKARHFWVLGSSLVTVSCLFLAGCELAALNECDTDADCEDGPFCTIHYCGANFFVNPFFPPGQCFITPGPCGNPTPICDEAGRRCLPCEGDAQCDDGLACTDDACDPETGACNNTDQCDDGVFCNGPESCDQESNICYAPNASPCGEGFTCVEETASCVCIIGAPCDD